MTSTTSTTGEPIAIVGTACRFPGDAQSPSKLWDLLHDPKDVLSEFPPERLRLSNFYNDNGEHHGSTNVENKSYLLSEDAYAFDAAFFNVNPLEAHAMDPQQRILLEVVYEAIERSGHPLDRFQGSQTSVFVGVMNADYYDIQLRDPETMLRYNATGTARSILSNRISYFFDLKGPSMTIDTACSSSLVALHQAVLSIRNGESTSAIVAGANLLLDPMMYIAESKLHMLSSQARSRMWDKSADGYARGEGFAAVVLKPLSLAIQDGDDIECIVRGTGVNSDGRTTGITMPSSSAQAELIRRTYRDAGLDPLLDRPQFVECHGTGTAAGDPVEARAVREAFFSKGSQSGDILYVGSIKTVIGHLEGCAGLAGVLKALLAMKHGIIPPNLHFDELSPAVSPYYNNLQIAKEPLPWPRPNSAPLRASVNSFGFGGTNAHVILEAFHPAESSVPLPVEIDCGSLAKEPFVGPLVFSAAAQSSLLNNVKQMLNYLKRHPSVDLKALSWTLQRARSTLPVRAFFSGSTRHALLGYIETAIQNSEAAGGTDIGTRVYTGDSKEKPAILGVFTGQGAQWATMGRGLIVSSPLFRQSIKHCEESLSSLPDPPTWSLMEEIMAEEATSRIEQAAFSQPLCTALQIALVDLCTAAGIKFDAVVGHSSGEIAAVYAAGILSAKDAIRIAYYRGHYAKHANGADRGGGSMMAVGMSLEAATSFCAQPAFHGRIGVAASNAPSSVTLSGDRDAIEEAKEILDDQKTFARLLKVDTAYHSHHMLSCAAPYLKSLAVCHIVVQPPREDCTWISSVRGDIDLLEDGNFQSLAGQYWVDNMVQPVLFSQAIECSLWAAGPFSMVLEVGPHPALKGPTVQTFKSALSMSLPYAGLLRRATDEVEAFSGGVGYVWSHLARSPTDFDSYRRAFLEPIAPNPVLLKDVPSYAWSHETSYWRESRISKQFRLRDTTPHELLGRRVPDDSEYELRWRNVMRLDELSWIRGHEFQGEALYPAMGYIAMAFEASKVATQGRTIRLLEIENFAVHQAVVLKEGSNGVETVFTLKKLESKTSHGDELLLVADFACYACLDESTKPLIKSSSGRLIIHYGEPSLEELPPRIRERSNLSPLDRDRFYGSLSKLGLNYHGLFKPQTSFRRCLSYATGNATWNALEIAGKYVVHPALMDVGLHSIFVAFASPVSEGLWATYLPTHISRLSLNPRAVFHDGTGDVKLDMDAFITEASSSAIQGNVHIFDPSGLPALLIEGVRLQAFTEAKASNDRQLFSKTVWDVDVAHGFSFMETEESAQEEYYLCEIMERTCFYFFRTVFAHLTVDQAGKLKGHFQNLYKAFQEYLKQAQSRENALIKKEWLTDSWEQIVELSNHFPGSIDLEMIHTIGNSLEGVLWGNVHLLDAMMKNDLLNRFYMEGRLFVPLNRWIGKAAKAISHKYPSMKILEIGAGTGGTTRSVLDSIGENFSSYSYTDISSGFFGKTEEKFSEHIKKMQFQILDIENDVTEQGFSQHSYDMVIAANVLHATSNLHETMAHVRSLIKPGGYLLMVEVTGVTLQLTYVMGGFTGWWLGVDDGRVHNPGISPLQWEELLGNTGFSGIESVAHDLPDLSKHSCSAIVSQAVDQKFDLMRQPVPSLGMIDIPDSILVLGGDTLAVSKLSRDVQKILRPVKDRIQAVKNVDLLESKHLNKRTSIICLTELDDPIFSKLATSERLTKLQNLIEVASSVLWITKGRLSDSPHSNMAIGLGRTLQYELADINIQFLDVKHTVALTANIIAEMFLRLTYGKSDEVAQQDILWNTEPESLLDGSRWLIPRVVPYKTLNDRYNAARRLIKKSLQPSEEPIEITVINGSLSVQENCWLRNATPPESTRMRVAYSTCMYFDGEHSLHLCLGTVRGTDDVALAIASSLSSVVDVQSSELIMLPIRDCGPALLLAIASHILCFALWAVSPSKGTVTLYEPGGAVVQAMTGNSLWKERKVYLATSNQADAEDGWIYFHSKASEVIIRGVLPRDMSAFIDLSAEAEQKSWSFLSGATSVSTIRSCMVQYLRRHPSTHELLQQAYAESKTSVPNYVRLSQERLTAIQNIPGAPLSDLCFPNIVHWDLSTAVGASVSPLNSRGLFSSKKTYLMIGLNSELGLSICHWMILNGAKYIVITSRSGKVNDLWLQEVTSIGAQVEVYSMDVTAKESILAVYHSVCQSMPPIAGVCNGAMVLSDKTFTHMSTKDLNDVFQPKVQGSLYLDEIFSEKPLDFFILFSSLASVVGNGGQANYHAANMFMTSLAAQRRARGLVASVIHIGLVVDVGYVARTGQALIDHLVNLFYAPLSESDIHQLFAEAVIASPLDSKLSPDIIMGVEPVYDLTGSIRRPPWYNNPIFSHLRLDFELSEGKQVGDGLSMNIREQLHNSESIEDATEALSQSFALKIEATLHLPLNSVNMNVPLLDLGIDSLLAVEIRQWFSNEINVDIPMLELLSGNTGAEICNEALRKYISTKSGIQSKTPEEPAQSSKDIETATYETNASLARNETSSSLSSTSKRSSTDQTSSPEPQSISTLSVDEKQIYVDMDNFKRVGKMSYSQSRLWLQDRLLRDPTSLNIAVVFKLKGTVNINRLKRAVEIIVSRHEALHSCYFAHPDNNEPTQGVLKSNPDCFQHVKSTEEDAEQLIFDRMQSYVWDLSNGNTLQIVLVSPPSGEHSLVLGYHHIVMDGVSWHLFLRDLSSAYQMQTLQPLKLQALDFSAVEASASHDRVFQKQLDYWKQEHSPLPEILPLMPFSHVKGRRPTEMLKCHTATRELSPDLLLKVKMTSQRLRATPFHLHLTIVQSLLFKTASVTDFCIGVSDANRNDSSFSNSIGFFLNVMALHFQIDGTEQFSKAVQSTTKKVFSAIENSAVPFELVLDKLNVPRSSAHSPLFQVAFNYRLGEMVHIPFGDCELELKSSIEARSQHDFVFNITESRTGKSYLQITSRESLYKREVSDLLCDMYISLLTSACADTDRSIEELPLHSISKIGESIEIGAGPRIDYKWPARLSEIFDEVASHHEHAIAVTDDERSLSYLALHRRANQIANTILKEKAAIESRIAVMLPPSTDLIASFLAVLHIGCVYVPIDLTLPEARQASILESCDPRLILCCPSTIDAARRLSAKSNLARDISKLLDVSDRTHRRKGSADLPSFLLYTSGSTGVPKGILLSQQGSINFIAHLADRLSLGQEVVLQQSSVGFDMSIAQILTALAHGGKLVIAPQSSRGDAVAICRLMAAEEVSLVFGTPSEYHMLLRYGNEYLKQYSSWRHACLGGETVSSQLKKDFEQLQDNCPALTDCYGPTEISMCTTFEAVDLRSTDAVAEDDYHSVGKAIPNTSIYIMDHKGTPLPTGFAGEICVSGIGLALGYWKMPELSDKKFIQTPYVSSNDKSRGWTRIFRTGDYGRLTQDGSLVFMGRIDGDTQIKLRGLRIDLEDVASCLLRTSAGMLTEAVISVRGDPSFLVAHVVADSGHKVENTDLQRLRKILPLPQYMCPSVIILMQRLPRTTNGKVDRKTIQKMELPPIIDEPATQDSLSLAEGELRLVWRDVLYQTTQQEQIGPDSDFFMEGGNSFLLTKLQGAIKEAYGLSIPLKDLYQSCTLSSMASLIEADKAHQPRSRLIDWKAETAVPQSVLDSLPLYQDSGEKIKRKDQEILLTGSTSFLGLAILMSLIEQKEVARIHCVAIDAQSQKHLPQSDKIRAYAGNLNSNSLGLTENERLQLQSTIDIIIHAGSNGHCLNNYSSLSAANLRSTCFLANLALSRHIPLNFLSSNRVTLLSGHTSLPPMSVAQHFPNADGSEGFTATKWAGERYLENISEASGLKIRIHRACAITGDEAPSEDALNAILRYSVLMRAVPKFSNVEGFFDFKDVHAVASEMVQNSLSLGFDSPDDDVGAPKARFRHYSSGVKVPVANIKEHMEAVYGYGFEVLPLKIWISRARPLKIESLIVAYLEAIDSRGEVMVFPYMGEKAT